MEKHRQLSDLVFEKQFKDLSLPPAYFTHEAHLRLAWILIHQYGSDKAVNMICDQILQFATKHGEPGKFHKTVTIAAVKVVYHFIRKSESKTFAEFIVQHPRLKKDFKILLNQHYGFNIFNSKEAKKNYIEPDLLPFT